MNRVKTLTALSASKGKGALLPFFIISSVNIIRENIMCALKFLGPVRKKELYFLFTSLSAFLFYSLQSFLSYRT